MSLCDLLHFTLVPFPMWIGPVQSWTTRLIPSLTLLYPELPGIKKASLMCLDFETGSHWTAQAGLKLLVHLPHALTCWISSMYHHTWLRNAFSKDAECKLKLVRQSWKLPCSPPPLQKKKKLRERGCGVVFFSYNKYVRYFLEEHQATGKQLKANNCTRLAFWAARFLLHWKTKV